MEKQMKELKEKLLKEELADFVFSQQMKANVFTKIEAKQKQKFSFIRLSKIVPISLSITAFLIFSVGIYVLITREMVTLPDPSPNPGQNTNIEEDPDTNRPKENFSKPELVPLDYLPEGYVFKHKHINEDLYENIYEKEGNAIDSFSYGIQLTKPEIDGVLEKDIKFTVELSGQLFKISDNQLLLLWKDEGVYQFVQKTGSLPESEFYKVVDSILKEQGFTTVLGPYISELEALEQQQAAIDEQLAFNEEKAIALLERFNNTINSAFNDATEDEKFNTYKTKEEFYSLFTDFVAREFVESTFSFRVDEKEDGLYVVPTEYPPHYIPEFPFQLIRISETEYTLTQYQETDLYGQLTLTITFKNHSGTWMILKQQIDEVSLPKS
ncbi:DUF4367 domain-containing protein [Mesobacillus subterraneus]|uniref:DUF4367 domain-containing protein n=1 Tax=Mesobacillus subterraneus TaxID=285983 RepID=UPI00203ECF53|nr:DUF4367 domain-containing protein [Mesobacillus subterraneus]MCM3664704.1 DUF4367 domain-containing protein [Mesobacillus subterraneus]MCM3683782.1 DUF4367 domain-containing protein [Mesobacillus subterraneus]